MIPEAENTIAEKVPLNKLHRQTTPDENGIMRGRLVIARVMNGFSVAEAQDRLGMDGIDIKLIESGMQRFPSDHRFIYKVAQEYAISTDFLFGLSPNAERDRTCFERYAVLRGFEHILKQQAQATTTAFLTYAASQAKLSRTQYEAISDSVDSLRRAIEVMRDKYGFDDVQGSATVLAALDSAERAIKPVRMALAAQKEIELLCKDLALEKAGPISYLLDESNAVYLEP